MPNFYVLRDRRPERATRDEWRVFTRSGGAQVAETDLGDVCVSTRFTGVAGPAPHPLLFETLVYDGPFDGTRARYATWDEAVAGHDAMVERVRGHHN